MSTQIQAPTPWRSRIVTLAILLTCVRVWLGPFPAETTAMAQLPNAGQKQSDQLAEARKTNQLLGEIRDLLKTGPVNVKVLPAPSK